MEQMDISDWCYHTHCLSAKWSVTRPWSDVLAQKAKISHTWRHIFVLSSYKNNSKVSYISITSVHVIQFHFTEKPQAGGNSHHHLLTRVYSYWSAEDLDCTMEAPQWHIPDSSSSGVQTSTRTSLSVKMPSSASRRPEEPQGFRDCLYMSRMPQKCIFKDLCCCHTITFGMTQTIQHTVKHCSLHRLYVQYCIVSVIPAPAANPSFSIVTLQHQHSLGAVKASSLKSPDWYQEFTASWLTRPILIRPRILLLFGSSLLQGSKLLVQQVWQRQGSYKTHFCGMCLMYFEGDDPSWSQHPLTLDKTSGHNVLCCQNISQHLVASVFMVFPVIFLLSSKQKQQTTAGVFRVFYPWK